MRCEDVLKAFIQHANRVDPVVNAITGDRCETVNRVILIHSTINFHNCVTIADLIQGL